MATRLNTTPAAAPGVHVTHAPDPNRPPPVPDATRRSLFGTMGVALLLVAPAAGEAEATQLDGEILAASAELLAIDRESDRLSAICRALPLGAGDNPAFELHDAHWDHQRDRYWAAADRLCAVPARTPEGLRAKAAAALSALPADDRDPGVDLAAIVLAELVGSAAA